MADWFTIAADRLHAVPDDLDDQTAALIEPLSTPVHAVRLAGDAFGTGLAGVRGKAVAVLGAGTIGLLVLAVLKAHGARRVVVTDIMAAKRDKALELGADAAVDAAAPDAAEQVRTALGESADIVVDCVAIEPTVRQAIAIAGKGGTVVIVGVPAADVTIPLALVQDHQIRIQGSATYLPEDYAESIRLLAERRRPLRRLRHRHPTDGGGRRGLRPLRLRPPHQGARHHQLTPSSQLREGWPADLPGVPSA